MKTRIQSIYYEAPGTTAEEKRGRKSSNNKWNRTKTPWSKEERKLMTNEPTVLALARLKADACVNVISDTPEVMGDQHHLVM